MQLKREIRYLKYYYLATPVFVVIEYLFGLDIRLEIPGDNQLVTLVYYGICFLAGFVFFNNQFTAAIFSLLECSVNILLLLLSILWPIINLGNEINAGVATEFRFGVIELFHFLMVGGVLLVSFYLNPLMYRTGNK